MKKDYMDYHHINEYSEQCLLKARFWTRILKEHAVFIELALPCDRKRLRESAKRFFVKFEALEIELKTAQKLDAEVLGELLEATAAIIRFKRFISHLLSEHQLESGKLEPLFVDHMINEAVYFLNILQKPETENYANAFIETEVFWLDIIKEHVKFMRRLIAPSEKPDSESNFPEKLSSLLQYTLLLDHMRRETVQFIKEMQEQLSIISEDGDKEDCGAECGNKESHEE